MKKKAAQNNNPLESLLGGAIPNFNQNDEEEEAPEEIKTKRSEIRQQLLAGKLEEEKLESKLNKTLAH